MSFVGKGSYFCLFWISIRTVFVALLSLFIAIITIANAQELGASVHRALVFLKGDIEFLYLFSISSAGRCCTSALE